MLIFRNNKLKEFYCVLSPEKGGSADKITFLVVTLDKPGPSFFVN